MGKEYKIPERKTETPFQFIEEDPLIACVGSNGGTSNLDIFTGFKHTVDLIYNSSDNPHFVEDVMVYPMVFCARHSVELGLKLSIGELIRIYELPKINGRVSIDIARVNTELNQHDIKVLANRLEQFLQIDSRLFSYKEKFIPLLSDYFFDKKGDMFRYSEAIDGTPNLVSADITQIGLTHLYKRFLKLSTYFDELYSEVRYLHYEYVQETYTSKFSRVELEEIAKELPNRNTWNDESFDYIKNCLVEKYKISKNDLCRAIKLIDSNPHLSIHIGKEMEMVSIPTDELVAYAEYVTWLEGDTRDDPILYESHKIKTDFDELHQKQEKRKEKAKKISDETLNILLTFSVIGQEKLYCEQFKQVYDNITNSKYVRSYLLGKMGKPSTYRFVLDGLKECGQLSYLTILQKHR